MQFYATIPESRKAFEIPGNRSEARMTLSLSEDQVPKALPLILLRGEMFDVRFQVVEATENPKRPYRNQGTAVLTLAAVAAKDNAIRINGVDGMSVILAIPAMNSHLLVQLLDLREKYLKITIPRRTRNNHDNQSETKTKNPQENTTGHGRNRGGDITGSR